MITIGTIRKEGGCLWELLQQWLVEKLSPSYEEVAVQGEPGFATFTLDTKGFCEPSVLYSLR